MVAYERPPLITKLWIMECWKLWVTCLLLGVHCRLVLSLHASSNPNIWLIPKWHPTWKDGSSIDKQISHFIANLNTSFIDISWFLIQNTYKLYIYWRVILLEPNEKGDIKNWCRITSKYKILLLFELHKQVLKSISSFLWRRVASQIN